LLSAQTPPPLKHHQVKKSIFVSGPGFFDARTTTEKNPVFASDSEKRSDGIEHVDKGFYGIIFGPKFGLNRRPHGRAACFRIQAENIKTPKLILTGSCLKKGQTTDVEKKLF
jgi:hypothetical protein